MSFQTCALLCLVLCAACGDDDRPDTSTLDGGLDRVDARSDSGAARDLGVDQGADSALMDAETDVRIDTNSPVDMGTDSGPDANLAPGECVMFGALGCAEGEWCEPNVDLDEGTCIAEGASEEGTACEDNTDCQIGLICTGTCNRACDPEAPEGTLRNPCTLGEGCGSVVPSDPSKLGICVSACDYDGGLACREASLTCQPEELVSTAFDLCVSTPLDLGAQGDCTGAGLGHRMLCGPARICLDRPDLLPGNLCYTVCRRTEGAIGVNNHPDCVIATQVCQGFADGLGVCVNP